MPSPSNALDRDCDVRHALNLRTSSKGCFGYLLSWSGCGGLSLDADLEVQNPFDGPGQTLDAGPRIRCVGLIEGFRFGGGLGDPMRIVAHVSTKCGADLRAKLSRPLTSTKASFGFYIVDFDPASQLWFESAFVRGHERATGFVDTTRGELQLAVAAKPTRVLDEIDLPLLRIEFQVAPSPKQSVLLEFATGASQKVVVGWGGGGDGAGGGRG